MKWNLMIAIVLVLNVLSAYEPHFMVDPAISPDGETVCFVYMDDLWSVPFAGGDAKRLTSTEGKEMEPVYSPDGKWIAFQSTFEGYPASYIIPSDGGTAKRISTGISFVIDWFPDSESLLLAYQGSKSWQTFYRVNIDGGRPEVFAGYGGNFASFTKDGDAIIYCDRGEAFREKYEGSINGELWKIDTKTKEYTRLTDTQLTERYPVCSKTEDVVYFSYSDGDNFQLFKAPISDLSQREQLTSYDHWSPRDISIAHDNDRMVYELFDHLETYDPKTGKTAAVPIEIKEQFYDTFEVTRAYNNCFEKYGISPDGKLIAFSVAYDLFAMPLAGGDVMQLTKNQAGIDDIVVMNDGTTVYYISYNEGLPQLYKTSVKTPGETEHIRWSKDRYINQIKRLANNQLLISFSIEDKRNYLALADSALSDIDVIVERSVQSVSGLSPDERYLIYTQSLEEFYYSEFHLYDLQEKKDVTLMTLREYIYAIKWGLDGKTAYYTRDSDIYRLDLFPKDDYYQQEDPWKDILDPETDDDSEDEDAEDEESGKTPVQYKLDDIRNRQALIIKRRGDNIVVHVIDDSTFYYCNILDDKYTLRKSDSRGEEDEKIGDIGEGIGDIVYYENPGKFFFKDGTTLSSYDPSSKSSELVKNSLQYTWNNHQLNQSIFEQVWEEFGHGFYTPDMHGVDWDDAYKRYKPYTQYAITPDMLGLIVEEMIGDVNASHTGFYPREDGNFQYSSPACLGIELDYRNQLNNGIRVQKVYRDSKLYEPFGIREGDVLLKINGVEIERDTDIEALLLRKVGKKIDLEFNTDGGVKQARIKGISIWANYHLREKNKDYECADIIAERTDNRVAYVHVTGMNWDNYEKFMDDLYVLNYDKEALILDFRGNGGGWIHDYVLEALTRKPYALSSSRHYNNRLHKTPWNLWDKPIVLLIDQNAFSDGEIFPFIFKELKLGKVIGMPTSGSVIGTGQKTFMDGSSMRMPKNGWYSLDGMNLEGNGVQPDIFVDPTPQQIIDEDDVQLERAIEEILKEI